MDEINSQTQSEAPKKDLILPASILIAGLMVAGSIVYLVQSQSRVALNPGVGDVANVKDTTVSKIVSDPGITKQSMVKGNANAPITVYEYSDFQCPFCGRFFSETLPDIQAQYVSTGKIKFVYKDYPLSFHPNALPAAIAARCADEQGKFWEYHDVLFANQENLSDANYKKWAADLGLNASQFASCVGSKKYSDVIKKDLEEGQKLGITGTPGFIIGGRVISGACPFGTFEQAITATEKKTANWYVDQYCQFIEG